MSRDDFHIDRQRMRAAFDRAAATYDGCAVLQREVGQRLLERLELIRLAPHTILDAGCGTGMLTTQLAARYPDATLIALDLSTGMLRKAREHDIACTVCGDVEHLPLAEHSVDMIFSNLTLQWCNDPQRAFDEFARVLKPGGVLMFSTLGPDTLRELRASWRAADRANHVNAFIDMHDLGDALMRAHLAEPVMDVEHITLTYPDARVLMRDLKALGAHNATSGRAHGLTGKDALNKMLAAYETFRRDGVLPATYEVVYGHAWGREPGQMTTHDGAAAVPLDVLRRALRRPPS